MQFPEKFARITVWQPHLWSWYPPPREIHDPPLLRRATARRVSVEARLMTEPCY